VSAAPKLRAPFPWFGGKSSVADLIWSRFGRPKQYIEPFCGSAAALLAAPAVASLEVIGDGNFYVANFWRAVKCQPEEVTRWQDYPVSHVDLYARHRWLTDPARTAELREALTDADWPGDAKIAGWWVWGQCAWIGSGWCDQ
jgi:DNA adenine methylase